MAWHGTTFGNCSNLVFSKTATLATPTPTAAWRHRARHMVFARCRRCFRLQSRELHARVWRMKLGDNEQVLAAEQFVHARNKDDKAMLPYDKRWLDVGGKSEFYFCSAKTAMARFTKPIANRFRLARVSSPTNAPIWRGRFPALYEVTA